MDITYTRGYVVGYLHLPNISNFLLNLPILPHFSLKLNPPNKTIFALRDDA